jgi:hypothetical protein
MKKTEQLVAGKRYCFISKLTNRESKPRITTLSSTGWISVGIDEVWVLLKAVRVMEGYETIKILLPTGEIVTATSWPLELIRPFDEE